MVVLTGGRARAPGGGPTAIELLQAEVANPMYTQPGGAARGIERYAIGVGGELRCDPPDEVLNLLATHDNTVGHMSVSQAAQQQEDEVQRGGSHLISLSSVRLLAAPDAAFGFKLA